MVTVFGTIALDTTRTPFRVEDRILGGAATYAALSASFFTKTNIVGVIGADFPQQYKKILEQKIDTRGIVIKEEGKTFHYDSSFDYDLAHRTTNRTELNVIADFEPVVPDTYRDSKYLYLANNDPIQNLKLMQFFPHSILTACDTIEYWILNKRDEVIKMISRVIGVIINDDEARLLCKKANLIRCAKDILSWGPEFVVIKKGEHGSILFAKDLIFPAPAYPLENIADPTGAGDSFAGGFMGHIARKGTVTTNVLKEAAIYGNVMGAFTVEQFGVKKLLEINIDQVKERYEKYRSLVNF